MPTKRKKPAQLTPRSLAYLREQGYESQVVEQFVRTNAGGFRRDLFGCIDVVAVRPGEVLGVQVCRSDDVGKRQRKATLDESVAPKLRMWLEAGARFVLHGWDRPGTRKGQRFWELRKEIEVTIDDLTEG